MKSLYKKLYILKNKLLEYRVNYKKEVESFNYRPDDIVLLSYPKSGSHWIRFLMSDIIKKHTEYKDKELDFHVCKRLVTDLSPFGLEVADPDSLPSPRILKSHSIYQKKFKNIIYLVRDGRDAMISYYYHHKKFNEKYARFDFSFLDFMQQGHAKKWADHIINTLYKDHGVSRKLYLLKYEDLLSNTKEELKGMLNYFNFDFTEEELINAIEAASFDKMQKAESSKGFARESPNKDIPFVRKGTKGDWRNYFGEREKKIFKKETGCLLNLLGYEKNTDW